MKKTILFVSYGLGIGGIEKCLVNLLNRIPLDKYSVDVLLMNPEYDLKSQIKPGVNFLNTFDYVMNTTDTIPYIKNNGGYLRNLGMLIRYIIFRILNKYFRNNWVVFKPIKKNYDYAIAYSHDKLTTCYVVDRICANNKYLFYHNGEYDKSKGGFSFDKKYYSLFNKIIAVSNDCKLILQDTFHFDEKKIIVLHNFCDIDNIIKLSTEYIPESFNYEGIHIVTVGRMTKEKGADIAVNALKKLLEDGYNIFWHWVGDGNQLSNITNLVNDLGIKDKFIFEGNQINPYPFIKCADIYVQPSYYEAYSTTITEAKVLIKAIVTTDVGGMREQLVNNVNASIVPIDSNEIYKSIKHLIDNPGIINDYTEALKIDSIVNDFSQYEKELFCD